MKVSNIGLISRKLTNLDEQFPVQDMLLQTGQIEQYAGGIYAYGHVPYLVKRNVEKIISDTLTSYGCAEVLLPILQPEKIWAESGRLDKYVSDGVMFRTLTKNGNYCLAPTAEEAIVAFVKKRLSTYKQLPVTYFQIGPKFRNEIRTRGYLLRGKAFEMLDAYSFGRNQEDLDKEYARMKQAYMDIFNKMELKVQPVGADSGAIGGSKSEEFMCLSDIGEDNILYDPESGQTFNSELLEREDAAQYLLETYGIKNINNVISRKAVELGHIFQLGNKYSKTMNGNYVDSDGNVKEYMMGCYGIGIGRTVAMIYENSIISNDGKFDGISLPKSVAPYMIYMIPKTDDKEKYELATELYNQLENAGVKVLFDDRQEISIGAKIKDSKIVGSPYMAVIGKSVDNGKIEVEEIKTGAKQEINIDEFVNYCKNL